MSMNLRPVGNGHLAAAEIGVVVELVDQQLGQPAPLAMVVRGADDA